MALSPEAFLGLRFDTRIMRQLGARVEGDGEGAESAIDGDPNTIWNTASGRRGARNEHPYPHHLTVTFPAPVAMTGLALMNRQNDRDHLGDIRDWRGRSQRRRFAMARSRARSACFHVVTAADKSQQADHRPPSSFHGALGI